MNEAINWIYVIRVSDIYCECPACEGQLEMIRKHNPYNYCPYCGRRLFEGDIKTARKKSIESQREWFMEHFERELDEIGEP